jgi:hypothetical protein
LAARCGPEKWFTTSTVTNGTTVRRTSRCFLLRQSTHAFTVTGAREDGMKANESALQVDRIHDIAEAGAEETREFRIFGPP